MKRVGRRLRRRDLLGFAAGMIAARAAPAAERAARIGVIVQDPRSPAGTYDGLIDRLGEIGLVNGKNLLAHVVSLRQPPPAIFAAAAQMVRSGAELLVALGPELALRAAVSAGGNLPIVIVAVNYDPIARGYAKSLARPGGNVSGIFIRQPELAEKQVELLSEAFPDRRRLAILWDALSADQFKAAQRRAASLGLTPLPLELERPPYDFAAAFASLAARRPQLLIVLSSPRFTASRRRIAELAVQYRLPSMFILKTYVEAGGLISYGYEVAKAGREAAGYVKKILDGAKPADLPIEEPDTYRLTVNLKTAKAIGIEMPRNLLARADEIIQ